MQVLAAVGGGAFILACLLLGARLMWLSWKTRGLEEFVLGLGLFLMGGLGYPLMIVALTATGLSDGVRHGFLIANMTCATVGMGGVAVFTQRVFRPSGPWGRVGAMAILIGYGACFAAQWTAGLGTYLTDPTGAPWSYSQVVAIACPVWTGAESFRHYRMLRRRLALDLADSVVTDRFLLWTIAMWTAAAITLISVALGALGIAMNASELGALIIGTLGLVIAGALWLAFFPPKPYTRWIRENAEAVAA